MRRRMVDRRAGCFVMATTRRVALRASMRSCRVTDCYRGRDASWLRVMSRSMSMARTRRKSSALDEVTRMTFLMRELLSCAASPTLFDQVARQVRAPDVRPVRERQRQHADDALVAVISWLVRRE